MLDMQETSGSERASQPGIQSVEVAGEILQALLRADGPMKLADLARDAGMPSAKAHRYLVSLMRIGLAAQDTASGRYDLGPVALQLGLKGFTRFEPLRFAEQKLREMVDQVGETTALAVWSDRGPAMVRVIEARHVLAGSVPPTHICPLTYSATGLLFSTFEDPSRTERHIERELEQNRSIGRPNAPHNRAELAEILQRTRLAGVSSVVDGGGDGIAAVSAPVFDVTGRLTMAVTVFGHTGRVDARPDGALSRLVASAASTLSSALGYRGSQQNHQF
jgi:DNA-binding IclR family transcriptional regulator